MKPSLRLAANNCTILNLNLQTRKDGIANKIPKQGKVVQVQTMTALIINSSNHWRIQR